MAGKRSRLLEKASETLDMPVDVIGGLPRMELRGRHQLYIESHSGIREYGDERIIIDTASGLVKVTGLELTIRSMNDSELTINGIITVVEFL